MVMPIFSNYSPEKGRKKPSKVYKAIKFLETFEDQKEKSEEFFME